MKIRRGFVSNSSSCSFCIYGISIEPQKLCEKLIENGIKLTEADKEEIYEWFDDKSNKLTENLGIRGGSEYDDYLYIGKEWANISDDQTGAEFKKEKEEKIEKLIGKDIKCFTHEEAWYNG